jgi:hypothetical protein
MFTSARLGYLILCLGQKRLLVVQQMVHNGTYTGILNGYEWDMNGILMVYEWDMNGINMGYDWLISCHSCLSHSPASRQGLCFVGFCTAPVLKSTLKLWPLSSCLILRQLCDCGNFRLFKTMSQLRNVGFIVSYITPTDKHLIWQWQFKTATQKSHQTSTIASKL